MRIVLLGPPGSGKAELSRMISSHYGMPIITVGSVMKRAAAEHTELGRLAKEAMDMSRVSDELLLALLRIQLPQMDLRKGFALVDLPKNAGQGDVLDSLLSDLDANIEQVFNLEVDRDELMERLVGRISCDSCGAQYNLYVNPPLVDGVCDECGARVVRRPDDYEETISNRLRIYEAQMGPLLQHYRSSDRLQRLAADDGSDATWKVLRSLMEAMERSKPAVSATEEPTAASAGAGQGKAKKGVPSAKPEVTGRDAEPPKAAAKPSGGAKKVAAKASSGADKREEKQAAPAKAAGAAKKSTQQAAKKAPIKKAAAQKAPAKKAPAQKGQAKKASAKKVSTKKPLTKKTSAKQAASKKSLTKKTAAKKSTAKQAAPKKASAKKPVAKKTAAKRPVAKKAAVKKAISKKAAAKKAAAKKAAAKKAVAQRSTAKGKKVSVRKAAKGPIAKKSATARVKATSKAASKRPAASKSTTKKVVSKKAKVSGKKAPRR